MQAAPVAGAGNEREREKSELLERMTGSEEIGEISIAEAEPVAEEAESQAEVDAAGAAQEAAEVAERKQAHELVAREFPEALKEGSELYEACQEEMAYLLDANSPLASDPQAELKIARRMVRMLGYSQRAAAPEAPPAPAKQAAQSPRRSVRPMPTGGAPVESPVAALERRVSGAKSTGEMLELMREIGTPFEALLKR